MIAAVHRRVGRVTVPQFPNGGGSLPHHISPSGICVRRDHAVGDVAVTRVGQPAHESLYADDGNVRTSACNRHITDFEHVANR